MQLFINTKGSLLRRTGERVVVQCNEKKHEFAADKIHSIVIATGVRLTSDFVQLTTQKNIDIVFLDQRGAPTSRVWQTRMGSTPTIRRRQLEASLTSTGLTIAGLWIIKKLSNQTDFLKELHQRRPNSEQLTSAISQINEATVKISSELESWPTESDLTTKTALDFLQPEALFKERRNRLLGLEGSAGRIYFSAIGNLLPAEYKFSSRSRRPATDSFNAMLNYS